MGNYRPISVIGHIAKIIEREIKTQMCIYLKGNDLITVDQSAYRIRVTGWLMLPTLILVTHVPLFLIV